MNTKSTLTWQDKFVKLSELDPNIALKSGQFHPSSRLGGRRWYLSSQIRITYSTGMSNKIETSALSAEEAVNNFWTVATETMPPDAALVIGLDDNEGFRWRGFKWEKVSIRALA